MQLKNLKTATSPAAVAEALAALPVGLDSTYERALMLVSEGDHNRAYKVLNWLALSDQPLTSEELSEALCIVTPPDSPALWDWSSASGL